MRGWVRKDTRVKERKRKWLNDEKMGGKDKQEDSGDENK